MWSFVGVGQAQGTVPTRRGRGSLLQNDMSLGAPHAKRAYPCTARCAPSIPQSQVSIDIKRSLGKINLGIGVMKVQRRRKHPMLEGENGFNQSGNACCRIEMTKIGFEGTYGTVTRWRG